MIDIKYVIGANCSQQPNGQRIKSCIGLPISVIVHLEIIVNK